MGLDKQDNTAFSPNDAECVCKGWGYRAESIDVYE